MLMHYRDYEAIIDFDQAAGFHGEVSNLRDVVTFQGRSVDELKQAFCDSVDDYLDFCRTRGETPDTAFSGELVVQVEPGLHRAMASAAKRTGVSLDAWVTRTLERAAG